MSTAGFSLRVGKRERERQREGERDKSKGVCYCSCWAGMLLLHEIAAKNRDEDRR